MTGWPWHLKLGMVLAVLMFLANASALAVMAYQGLA